MKTLVAILLVSAMATAAWAETADLNAFPPQNLPEFTGTPQEIVKKRQDYMKDMGRLLKDIKKAAEADNIDREALRPMTQNLRSLAYGMIKAFPPSTRPGNGVDTKTLDTWWTDEQLAPDHWSSYFNAADKLDKMVPDAEPDALRDQVKTVSGECGSCHKALRKPD